MTTHRGQSDVRTEGFRNATEQPVPTELPSEGVIPTWLAGTLLRNGPAHFGEGRTALRHWFDGLAMVHRFHLEGGRVTYSNSFLDTPNKRALADAGKLTYPEFATDPCRSLFKKIFTHFSTDRPSNYNGSVNIARIDGKVSGITETPLPIEFDPATLETVGVVDYDDRLRGNVTSAHPGVHPGSGDLVNYLIRFSRQSSYTVYRQPSDSSSRSAVAVIPVDRPSYMHSFAVTENHAVLVEFPHVVDPLSFVLRNRAFIKNYRWKPRRGTNIRVIDLETGEVNTLHLPEPLFAFHHVNAFADPHAPKRLHLDLVGYSDTAILNSFYLDNLRSGKPIPHADLIRIDLDLEEGTAERRILTSMGAELPRIDPDREGLPYRFAYGIRASSERGFYDRLVKVDTHSGEHLVWEQEGLYPGEPVFVPSPDRDPHDEDDGVILAVALDLHGRSSVLLVLDARDMRELGRARTPQTIPFGFHGTFIDPQ
ncbi:carotenoid oxygenase family protein [Saccharopolyspora sp. NPDC050389]|uniref:carotenoid oxygenase family protein n=1 Tax=Saccharopolyspora sp. NPDC050389 TaxID=3155516 RepID=UPI0033DEF583